MGLGLASQRSVLQKTSKDEANDDDSNVNDAYANGNNDNTHNANSDDNDNTANNDDDDDNANAIQQIWWKQSNDDTNIMSMMWQTLATKSPMDLSWFGKILHCV